MSTAIKSYRPTVYYKYNVISVSLFIFVICMLVVSSQGWSGSDTCDGQMIQNLNKTQSSIDNIWERKPKPTDGYLFFIF